MLNVRPIAPPNDRPVYSNVAFNIFVFAQIFNSINSRRLDNKLNIFEGITRNWYFMTITFIGEPRLLKFCASETADAVSCL